MGEDEDGRERRTVLRTVPVQQDKATSGRENVEE